MVASQYLAAIAQLVTGKKRRFYVDATGGNDANSGRSAAAAWQTVNKINAYTGFRSGDHIFFKRGKTWALTEALTVPAHGLSFGAYGSGNKPVLDGQDAVDCVLGNSKHGTRFENIELTQGLDYGFSFNGSHDTILVSCDVHDCGNDNILFMGTGAYGCKIKSCTSYNPYERVVGLTTTCLEIADGAHDIVVEDLTAYGSPSAGISIHCHTNENLPYNLTVKNSTVRNNAIANVQILVIQAGGLGGTNRSILFKDCVIHSGASYGIWIGKDAGAAQYVDGVTFQNCRSYDNTNESLLLTGDNCTFQQCELVDGRAVSVSNSVNPRFINCTMYNPAAAVSALRVSGARMAGMYGRNNIICCDVVGQVIITLAAATGVTGWDWDYNLYRRTGGLATNSHWTWLGTAYSFANWKTQSGGDANSPAPADPLFVDRANNDFTLQAGSPAIDAGVDVGLSYSGSAPDCGAYEKA